MVKKNFKCSICHTIGKVYLCRFCHHGFCQTCILKSNPSWVIPNTEISNNSRIQLVEDSVVEHNEVESNRGIESTEEVENNDDSNLRIADVNNSAETYNIFTEDNNIYINYCAFNCVRSLADNYCYDCGGNYMRMKKCLSCNFTFCTFCQKKNLLEKKNIRPEKRSEASLFCSQTCYEIYTEQPNNTWCICEDCGVEYFDISYKKCCEFCLDKYHFHKNYLYNCKRNDLIEDLKSYLKTHSICLQEIQNKVQEEIDNKVKQYNTIKKMKIDITDWFSSVYVGNNLSYNIWDEVINDFLIKN